VVAALDTARLRLREQTAADAPFLLALMNEPAWLRYIGDRGVRTEAEARAYIESVTRAMYAEHGVGLLLVERREDGAPVGICGLLHRDGFDLPDLGVALAEGYRGRGYAAEAAAATLAHARQVLGVDRVLAFVSPGNEASVRLLDRLGFAFERSTTDADCAPVDLYARAP
jgi:RimJ/RimL family protein N-acetyltransferase